MRKNNVALFKRAMLQVDGDLMENAIQTSHLINDKHLHQAMDDNEPATFANVY